ncbi:MAG TPA: hypothetical protein PKW98_17590 [Candidatus Wallbacteria bacterium]|nr:MAG: hypothetical protein BWY32_00081 [bacterium ADurb.Bin243]HOD43158.1 hypothetical protein [Candidatus Wallbacteria bacterium]HPG59636.1 hypothetical protein [Candidatus Wallbacteria bacterium]
MNNNNAGEFAYIFGGSVPKNIKIHSLLEACLDCVTLDPAPEWLTSDCAIIVKIKKRDLGRAKEILKTSNIFDVEYIER